MHEPIPKMGDRATYTTKRGPGWALDYCERGKKKTLDLLMQTDETKDHLLSAILHWLGSLQLQSDIH
uniref:Uncharacterized protein n=1 Tax=Arundo donax TaxID=35708 RepID=A0A0A9EE48_ARUDO